ncbi:hypothetical protein PICST_67099 [Scheffersomyces stipitis CBS 6054]|uniref:Uncharacterized protein n=1 Tax=Scheffersomyces stipitis (strain ATCC 58785 / CBS 6054 / NBRC 10063 / NRRL Y-11545) TaxID=322104 RepID=A3LQA5_PICST|nr:hypothetical protein PICST_67099 [Scheffersomyces stipitis CBS 6054]ABN65175.2 hypothetical protein PICST_67099 [Scheffersomyces stipitis CBS 6054]
MQFSKLFTTLAAASIFTTAMAAPPAVKRDDDDVVIVKVKTTVQDYQTNYHTVEGPVQTKTNLIINTSTLTVTRYTATVTSTVFGTPHTYTTVATTPVSPEDVVPNSENEVTTPAGTDTETTQQPAPEPTTSTTSTETTPTTESTPSTQTPPTTQTTQTTNTPETTSLVQPVSTSLEAVETTPTLATKIEETTITGDSNDGPTITAGSVPTSTDSWIIGNISTVTSSGVCYVDYDYYYATESEADETVTSTSTIYTTVTQL